MADMTFEEILRAARKLNPRQKALLVQQLEASPLQAEPTREELIAELEALRADGAFESAESLRNHYANPALDDLTDAQLSADIHGAANEWEQELDEYFGDED